MELVISNVKLGSYIFIDDMEHGLFLLELNRLLVDQIHKNGITCNSVVQDKTIVFRLSDGGVVKRLFLSQDKNKVKLKPGDSRIEKLKRDYILTNRLTKEQTNIVWNNIINGTLNKLQIECLITFHNVNKQSQTILR